MRQLVLFLLLFGFCIVSAQSTTADPLETLIRQTLDSIYNTTSDRKLDSLYRVGQRHLQRARAERDIRLEATVYQLFATWHYMRETASKSDSMLHYDQLALRTYEQTTDSLAIAKALGYVGAAYEGLRNFSLAQEYALKSLAIYERHGDKAGIASAFSDLTIAYRNSEDYERAAYYGEKTIALDEQSADSINLGISLFYIVPVYIQLKDYETALQRANRAVNIIENNNGLVEDVGALVRAYSNRGAVYIKMGDYDKALSDHYRAWEIAKSITTNEADAIGFTEGIARVKRLQGDCETALKYYLPMVQHIVDNDGGNPANLADMYHEIADCYEQIGDLPSALKYERLGFRLDDTVQTNRYAALETELLYKYETGKKDQQIIDQMVQLQQRQRIQGLTWGILGLTVLLLAILFWFYQRNRNNNSVLREKNERNEFLVKEIHHRVKNNLQILSSLLYLQSRHIEDPTAFSAIKEGQNRVEAMGLIHQKLYTGDDMAAVNIRDYVRELGETLLTTLSANNQNITLDYQIVDLLLDVDTAIPLGLIINELLTNSLKYAFANQQTGKLTIELFTNSEQHLVLRVTDEHASEITATTDKNSTGFGSSLIKILSKKLKGKPVIQQFKNGYRTEIVFQRWSLSKDLRVTQPNRLEASYV